MKEEIKMCTTVTDNNATGSNVPEIFSNPEFGDVRVVMIGEKPYFCASDIANALGYSNPRNAISRHCKGVVKHDMVTSITNQYGTTTNQTVEMTFIPEGDIYRLIMKSKLPAAERFESWVMDEVLSTIRKHGSYMGEDIIEQALASPDFLIQLATQLKEEKEKRKRIEEEKEAYKHQVIEMQPKATYYDVVLQCPDVIPIMTISIDYGWSVQKMNKYLAEKHIQYKKGGTWFLYQEIADKGYTKTEAQTYKDGQGNYHVSVTTCWTQKGRLFIYETLKNDGILPLIEREDNE